MRLLGEAKAGIPVQMKDYYKWHDEILVGAKDGCDYPFVDTIMKGWKRCRVEVKL